ncbi:hypothetical protein [Rhizobium sp.]|uniref:hypothetical protein n=1 Tax=Rhizobium sp. TaxID=391 RepID=UPI002AA73583
MRNKTENRCTSPRRAQGILAAAALAGMLFAAPIASAHPQAMIDRVTASDTTSTLDPIATGSIGTTLSQAHAALDKNGIDHAVAGTLSSVQIPSYLSILADRRILVLLSLIGLCVVWINRTPQNRDDGKN